MNHKTTLRFMLGLLLMALIVPACTPRGSGAPPVTSGDPSSQRQRVVDPRQLTAVERYAVERGAPDEVMELVFNDHPAGDALLRQISAPVDPADPTVLHLALRMLATVRAAPGVGIAAVQVGIPRRLVWVQRFDRPEEPFEALLNPVILQRSAETTPGWEGCLSVREIHAQVLRVAELDLQYDSLDGQRYTETIRGFTAVIVQHELDHLDGVLFVDRMEAGTQISRQEYLELRARERKASGEAPSEESTSADPAAQQPGEEQQGEGSTAP